jgi:predicted kinase
MLIIFGGLPGVGKTTIAKALAKQLKAVYLRVDTVEQVLKREAKLEGPEGYMVCWAQALENLKLGISVIADSVNAIQVTREAWQMIAKDASVTFLEVELQCSDAREHQRRIETRDADIVGHQSPTWDNVQQRQYESWRPHLVFDTAKQTVNEIVEEILLYIKADILSKATIEHIISQEKRLLDRTELEKNLSTLIDDEFIEIGSSATHYNKADVIQWLSSVDQSIRSGTDFLAKLLENHLVLLTYTSHIQNAPGTPDKKALRSSIWRKQDDIWQMVFHQGTPMADNSSGD